MNITNAGVCLWRNVALHFVMMFVYFYLLPRSCWFVRFQVLIPLHKPGQLPLYHPQLSYAVIQFVEKEPALSEDIVLGLLRFWPVAAAKKQVSGYRYFVCICVLCRIDLPNSCC